jgi:hypothetical protein
LVNKALERTVSGPILKLGMSAERRRRVLQEGCVTGEDQPRKDNMVTYFPSACCGTAIVAAAFTDLPLGFDSVIKFDSRVKVGRLGLGLTGARDCGRVPKSLKVYVVEGIAVSGLEIFRGCVLVDALEQKSA